LRSDEAQTESEQDACKLAARFRGTRLDPGEVFLESHLSTPLFRANVVGWRFGLPGAEPSAFVSRADPPPEPAASANAHPAF